MALLLHSPHSPVTGQLLFSLPTHTSSSEAFGAHAVAVAAVAKSQGHPARVALVRLLLTRGTCTVGELVQELPLSQSTVSQHLLELRQAGLVVGTAHGARICYGLQPEQWKRARVILGGLLRELA